LKKIFYAFVIFLVIVVLSIVSAVNSSIVIDKIAKKFAPDYNLSYTQLSGNVFTGIKIDQLKYNGQTIANDIVYRWDPVSLLQKKILVDEIKIEHADIEVIKSLIASFDVDETDDNSSEPFHFDVEVENVSISLNPFEEEGISFKQTLLKADAFTYKKEGTIEVENLSLEVDSNLTKLSFKGGMQENTLHVNALEIESLDTQMLEKIIMQFTKSSGANGAEEKQEAHTEPNPLIPTMITLEHFKGSLQPRVYKGIELEKLNVAVDDVQVDVAKIVANQKESLAVGHFELWLESNVTDVALQAKYKEDKVVVEQLTLKDIDTLALQQLTMKESQSDSVSESNRTIKREEPNALIPKTVVIKHLQTDILPAAYDPVTIETVRLEGKNINFDVEKLLIKEAMLDLNGTTNLSNLSLSSEIKNNHIAGKIVLTPNKPLFELYKLPLRKEAIGTIIIDLNASKEHIEADVKAKAKHILSSKEGEFNVDIEHLLSHVSYTVETKRLKVDSNAVVTTPYAKGIILTNQFIMDHNITYSGEVKAKELHGLEGNFTKPLNDLRIQYSGDAQSIQTEFTSEQLKGSFDSVDFKKGVLHLETTRPIILSNMITLPEPLKEAKLNAIVDAPVDFNHTMPLQAKVKIDSNVANIDADVRYDKTLKLTAKTTIPKASLLRSFNKEVKWDTLTPLDIAVDMGDQNVQLKLTSKEVNADATYFLESSKVQGKATLGGLVINANGIAKKKVKIDTKITSMKALKKSIATLYTLEELPPLEGSAEISATISELQSVELSLTSPKITYKADRKTEHLIHDIKLRASLDQSKIRLDSYTVTYDKQKIFSTKPSTIEMDGSMIKINPLWLNDALSVTGTYDLKTAQGKIVTKAEQFPIRHEYADIDTMIDIETLLDGNTTSVNGKVTLLGGKIKYDVSQKSFASDSDIIIVQEMQKKKASPFMDNLSANIQIKTKEPLVLKQGAINIKLKPDLGINKVQHGPLLVLGSIELAKGGSYTFEGKKFILAKSFIHFTGNPNKPLLEIKVTYKSVKHLITITVSGTPDAPNINFSSSPKLTKEQILSVILFDSEAGGDTHSGDEMMKMMGGAMAKSALADMGIKLDHLVLGEGNSVEVGKKLTNKITIIYVNDIVSSVKLKYEHSPRTESVIEVSEESQSYDIIYKRDF
jgi:translocation and assembly module TamB